MDGLSPPRALETWTIPPRPPRSDGHTRRLPASLARGSRADTHEVPRADGTPTPLRRRVSAFGAGGAVQRGVCPQMPNPVIRAVTTWGRACAYTGHGACGRVGRRYIDDFGERGRIASGCGPGGPAIGGPTLRDPRRGLPRRVSDPAQLGGADRVRRCGASPQSCLTGSGTTSVDAALVGCAIDRP